MSCGIIRVGSVNPIKLEGVEELTKEYAILNGMIVKGYQTQSNVSEQPTTEEEIVNGALNRARFVFHKYGSCAYGVGIEDGVRSVPFGVGTRFVNECACIIYDGNKIYFGLSSAFEYPQKVLFQVLVRNKDINQAFIETGLTDIPRLGSEMGSVGLLTKGRVNRKEYIKQAIRMAVIQIENSDLY